VGGDIVNVKNIDSENILPALLGESKTAKEFVVYVVRNRLKPVGRIVFCKFIEHPAKTGMSTVDNTGRMQKDGKEEN
jgi:hypothetical protein